MKARRVGASVLSLVFATSLAVVPGSVSSALAASKYTVEITNQSPTVQYFRSFSYDKAAVDGPNRNRVAKLNRKINRFVLAPVEEFRSPDQQTRDYLKTMQPAGFTSTVEAATDCRSNYICISQSLVFVSPKLAGSMTDLQDRAWSTRTAKVAQLKDFVSPGELPRFTRKVKKAITQADCYYGFPVKLPAKYGSFSNWLPLEGAIQVRFPEYQFGCQPMELTISWR